jgi:galactokinase
LYSTPSFYIPYPTMDVPTATSLRDIYPEDAVPVETKRWESLLAKFEALYGKSADFVARSPGRVNIIGEVIMLRVFRGA